MAVGRISGPLLKSNLIRNGIDLAFETDLLYLDVNNQRVGIQTATPQYELDVSGTTKTTNLIVTDRADLADITVQGNTISTTQPFLNLATLDTVVALNKIRVNSVDIEGNAITTNESNANLEFRPNGTGAVNVHSNLNVDGNIYASGNITADGNITIGDADTDNVIFNADVSSNIIPDLDDVYALGSDPTQGGKQWNNVWINNLRASSLIVSDNLDVGNIDFTLTHGNTYYVAENGDDTHVGNHFFDPFASVKYALSVAVAGDTILISPGVYTEEFPLTIPSGVTVKGEGIRSVTIEPTIATNTNDAFLLNGETTVEELTITGFYSPGYAFKYAPNYTATSRSPYIRNITVITQGSVTTVEDPRGFNAGDAGKGVFLDGSAASSSSVNTALLFHSVTFITPGVDAVVLTNGARVEWLNSFTYFANRSMYAYDSPEGRRNAGKTKLTLAGITGTFAQGNTITITSSDASTVLTGTISSVDGNDVYVSGYLDLDGFDLTPQSITDGTATATTISSFDLRDFGAEVRLIASASVYGNQGLVGQGPGVIMYAIGHNLAYIGNGKEVDNNPATVVQANEVVESAGAKIRYNSVDHKGDFRVGDLFYVNQETGNVNFAVSDFTIDTENGVTFNTNGNTTLVDGTKIETGDWRISENTVETLTQDANFKGGSGTVNLNSNVNINGSLDVTGNVTIGGNITIGDEDTDTIEIVAGIDSDINPKTSSTYNLGTAAKTWKNLYVDRVNLDNITITDNYITTTVSNSDLELRANGTGEIYVPSNNVQIDNDLTVSGTTTLANTIITGTITHVGDYVQTGNLDIAGTISNGDIQIAGNVIETVTSNADLELRANSTGEIYIPDNNVQIDNNLTVSGVTNLQDTFITGTITHTGDYVQTGDTDIVGNVTVTQNLDVTGAAQFEELLVDDNYITTTTSNADLELRANGTGKIYIPNNDLEIVNTLTVDNNINANNLTTSGLITSNRFTTGNIVIDDNFIQTTQSNSNLDLRANGTGLIYVPNNDVLVNDDFTISGTSNLQDVEVQGNITQVGNTTQTGNINLTGDFGITGNITVSNTAQFENIKIEDNFITTTESNSDLDLRTTIYGIISIPSNDVEISNNLNVVGTSTVGNLSVVNSIISNTYSTGDILIDDNFITTTNSNSDLELRASGAGQIYVPSNNVQIDNNLTVNGSTSLQGTTITGNITHTGNVTQIGDINLDGNLDVSGEVIISASVIQFEDIQVAGNTITTTESNSNLELRANGTGRVYIPENDIVIENNLTVDGTITVNNITSTGTITANSFTTGDILIDDNFITTTTSNSDLELRANGTGSIIIDEFSINNNTITSQNDFVIQPGSGILNINATGALKLPVGTTLERPTAIAGQIRYNSNLTRFEGYNGTNWINLKGVEDLDGDTKVTAELTEGLNDGTIRFDVQGSTIVSIDNTKLSAPRIDVGNIRIDNNVIETITADTGLTLKANGTGSVTFDNIAFKDNTITNTVADSVTVFQNTGNGYVKFDGAYGIVLPSGGTGSRPPFGLTETGQTRYNTDDERVEIWDGTNWVSVAGAASGITRSDAEEIALSTVLVLG